MKINSILLFCFSSICYSLVNGQNSNSAFDKNLKEVYRQSNFPGFAVSIIKKDSIVFSGAYGYADILKNKPYTCRTIQPIGSVSKTFVALALMKCIELGYFSLETPINDLLPFKVNNPYFLGNYIKIKHLATHTSSLLDNDTTYSKTYTIGNKPQLELGTFLKEYYTAGSRFYSSQNFSRDSIGSSYVYSNIATALAAYIIEVKSNMSFTEFTADYIFKPLKMENTGWFYNDKNKKDHAVLYQINTAENHFDSLIENKDHSLKTYIYPTYADGSLKTSQCDLELYLKAMMNGYFMSDASVISFDSYKNMFARQFQAGHLPANMKDTKEPNRAIFWAYSKKGDLRHTGSDPGVFALISFTPDTKIGKIILINACLDGNENTRTIENFKKIMGAIDKYEILTK